MSSDRDVVLSTLAQRLRLERPLVFLDLETTGTSVESDRIVEVALVKIMPSGDVVRFVALVHPGVPIPGGATAVHGIADDHVAGSPAFAAIAHELAALLAGCDIGGFNVGRFDLRLLACELERAGVPHALAEARVVDAMTIYHRNERRDLSAAVRFYNGREHDGHRAVADVDATIDVLVAQLDRYGHLPASIDELADYCSGRQRDWLTPDGKIAWRDGAARLTFGRHAGKSLQTLVQEEEGYLRWILDKDFPVELKRVISDAMAGQLPTPSYPA